MAKFHHSVEIDRSCLKTTYKSTLQDLRVNNNHETSFDDFWDITVRKIKTLLAAAVDDHCHAQAK